MGGLVSGARLFLIDILPWSLGRPNRYIMVISSHILTAADDLQTDTHSFRCLSTVSVLCLSRPPLEAQDASFRVLPLPEGVHKMSGSGACAAAISGHDGPSYLGNWLICVPPQNQVSEIAARHPSCMAHLGLSKK